MSAVATVGTAPVQQYNPRPTQPPVSTTTTSASGPSDSGVPADRLANARLGDGWGSVAGTPEQTTSGRVSDGPADATTGTAAANTSAPPNVRNDMVAAGMQNVSDPPTDGQLRTWYSQHAPHHEQIANHQYGDAARAYRQDAAALPENDPQRRSLEQRANQLDYAAHMQEGGRQVSFPPTFNEVKGHFRGLRNESAQTVGREYDQYSRAFYNHIQREGDPNADVKYDHESGPVRGERGRWGTDTPEDFSDVTDQRNLNGNGQRNIDCEGYAWMGEQLFKEAGFRQAGGDHGYKVIRPADGNGAYNSHVVVNMTRGNDSAWISNDHAYASTSPNANYRGAMSDSLRALSSANGGETRFSVYNGASVREATVHADTQNLRYND